MAAAVGRRGHLRNRELRIGRDARHGRGRGREALGVGHDHEGQLLPADQDAIARLQALPALDLAAVHDHAVAALQILDDDGFALDGEERVAPAHQRIVERELAASIAPDGELPLTELEVVVQVAQTKAHGPSDDRVFDVRPHG